MGWSPVRSKRWWAKRRNFVMIVFTQTNAANVRQRPPTPIAALYMNMILAVYMKRVIQCQALSFSNVDQGPCYERGRRYQKWVKTAGGKRGVNKTAHCIGCY